MVLTFASAGVCLMPGDVAGGSKLRTLLLIGWLIIPGVLLAQIPSQKDDISDDAVVQDSGQPLQLSFKNRPSLRIGEFAHVDLKASWHFDFRSFSPDIVNLPGLITDLPSIPPIFLLTRARVALKGNITKRIDFEFERDMRSTFGPDHEYHPWKDAYVNVLLHRLLQVQVGKFKIPFGLEETGSEDRQDYTFQSRTTNALTPARERGVMAHASFLKDDRLEYQVGVFRYDGEGSDIHGIPTGGRTYAARLGGEPLRYVKLLPKTIRHVYLGAAATAGGMFSGLNGISGKTFSGFTYLDHMDVSGNRVRMGAEMGWLEGPFSLKGEYIHVSEERKQQGIRGNDLPDKISRGRYLSGSWTAVGQMKSSGKPKNPFLTGHGFGVLELSARYDVLAFYSAPGPGLPARDPRAPTILPDSERTWTVGPTWYLNHLLKIQLQGQRERVTDIERKAVFGLNYFWTGIIRLQVAM